MHNEIFTDFSADLRTCRPCFFCQTPQISKLSGHPAIRDRLLIPQKVTQGSFFPKQSRTLQVSAQRFLKHPASLLGTPTAVYELFAFPKEGYLSPNFCILRKRTKRMLLSKKSTSLSDQTLQRIIRNGRASLQTSMEDLYLRRLPHGLQFFL